ncbi:MAG: restriction endonuclease subunit S, partial [Prevotella sp.]|nr:restriction endonuclease subunit S [Prevotella sp.]
VMLHLTKKEMEEQIIKLPCLTIQQHIASILKSLDDKIEVNRRINDNLEQQAQAAFDELIMDEELPRTKFLKDYAFVNPSRTIKKGEVKRYIDMSSLPTQGSFPSDWINKPYNGGMKFQNGDTIMARITPCLENGKTAYINFLEKDEIAYGSTEYIVMTPQNGMPSEMFYFLARNEDFVSYAVAHMNGSSGRQRVSATDIENYIMPDIPTQSIELFGKKTNAVMECIKNNSFENRKLAILRDTLLPKLMSGELKVFDKPNDLS